MLSFSILHAVEKGACRGRGVTFGVSCSAAWREELVVAAQAQEAGMAAAQEAAAARGQARALAERLVAAEELLGEREEQLSELLQDLQDVKQVRKRASPTLPPPPPFPSLPPCRRQRLYP